MGAYRKEIALTIGPISTIVDLHTMVPSQSKGTRVRRVCPDHKTPLKQRNVCPEDDKAFEWGEWMDAVETPDGFRAVDTDSKPGVEKASKSLELVPVPSKEIADNTFEGDSAYWLKPSNEVSIPTWSILIKQIKSGKTVFLTRGAFTKGHKEKLWKIELFRDYPVLREVRFPETINDPPEAEPVSVDKETSKLVKQFVDMKLTSWEDIDTKDNLQDQFEKWLASGDILEGTESKRSTSEDPASDLVDLLHQAMKEGTKNKE